MSDEYLLALINKLPPFEIGWSKELRDAWLVAATSLLRQIAEMHEGKTK